MMPDDPRYVKILITPELLETLFTRDEQGNRLSLELGEPDAEGFYTPTITTHYEDNPFRVCGTCSHESWDYNGDACDEKLREWEADYPLRAVPMDAYIIELTDHCHFEPSRWTPFPDDAT
jgi:hypothetical protein